MRQIVVFEQGRVIHGVKTVLPNWDEDGIVGQLTK